MLVSIDNATLIENLGSNQTVIQIQLNTSFMKIFRGHCAQPCFFESHSCENCGHLSGFRDEDRKMLTFDPNMEFLIEIKRI
jgi:hypothetical protein